jgi:hypothetical protein
MKSRRKEQICARALSLRLAKSQIFVLCRVSATKSVRPSLRFSRPCARRARNQKAPYNCIAAAEAASTLPFDQGMQLESELFQELVMRPWSVRAQWPGGTPDVDCTKSLRDRKEVTSTSRSPV